MISQMRASDQWNYYQAKGVKGSLTQSKVDILKAVGKTPDQKDVLKVAQYKKDQEEIKENADEGGGKIKNFFVHTVGGKIGRGLKGGADKISHEF